MIDIGNELARIVADARAHGQTMVDLATLERLLHRRHEHLRRDLLAEPHAGMLVVDLQQNLD